MRRIAVIGLSTFGLALVRALHRQRCEILAVDLDEEKIDAVRDLTYEAVVADARDQRALASLRLPDYDAVVISLGEPLDASLLALMHLRDLGARPVFAKAVSQEHARLLEALGADDVIFPELDVAEERAHTLANPGFVATWGLGADFAIAEAEAKKGIVGKTLTELDLRDKFNLNVIAVRDNLIEKVILNPDPAAALKDSDTLIVFGKTADVDRFVRRS
jgi:trk system potassium uptake protein TrkA